MSKQPLKFYGGKGEGALIRSEALPLGVDSFEQFVDDVLNVPKVLEITREKYMALDKKSRNRAKRMDYVCPCTFKANERITDNATGIVLLCLDIDDHDLARPYYSNPGTLDDQLEGMSFAVYATASSTPEKPTIRVMVPADNLGCDLHKSAVLSVAHSIGLSSVTKESLTTVQAMFLPCAFRGQDLEWDHPLLHFNKAGRLFTAKDILTEEELSTMTVGKGEALPKVRAESDTITNELEFLASPVDGITMEVAAKALESVDPDIDYRDWLKIACALKHQFPGDQAETAYELFDTWSKKGEKYCGAKDTTAKWKSMKPHAKGRNSVTIRSLLFTAKEAGWDSSEFDEATFEAFKVWTAVTPTVRQLLKETPIRLAAIQGLNKTEQDALLSNVVDAAKTRFKTKASIAALRSDLHKKQKSIAVEKRSKAGTPSWARGMIYVEKGSIFYRSATGQEITKEALDDVYTRFLLDPKASHDGIPEGKLPAGAEAFETGLRPRDLLLHMVQVPTVTSTVYDPRENSGQIITINKVRLANTYRPTHPEPSTSQKEIKQAGKLLMRHLTKLFADPVHIKILLDFLAYQVQSPGEKIAWATLIQGAQGCGKSFLFKLMKFVLGWEHTKEVGPDMLIQSSFNDWAVGAHLIGLEEIRVVGKNRHTVMDKLKTLITEDIVPLNKKFKDLEQVPNVSNYIMFTNHQDSLALSDDDRRYFVLQSRLQTKAQVAAELGPDYFEELHRLINPEDLLPAARAWFEQYEISESFEPKSCAPITVFRRDLIDASASDEVTVVRELIEDGDNPLCTKKVVMIRILSSMIDLSDSQVTIPPQRLAILLAAEGFVKTEYNRKCIGDGERHTLWVARGLEDQVHDIWKLASCIVTREDEDAAQDAEVDLSLL